MQINKYDQFTCPNLPFRGHCLYTNKSNLGEHSAAVPPALRWIAGRQAGKACNIGNSNPFCPCHPLNVNSL